MGLNGSGGKKAVLFKSRLTFGSRAKECGRGLGQRS